MSNYFGRGCHALYNRPVPFGMEDFEVPTTEIITVPKDHKMVGGKIVPERDYKEHFKNKAIAMGAMVVIAVIAMNVLSGK